MRSLAAPKSSIVVDIRDFVAHVRAIVLLAFHSLWIYQPLVLSLDTHATSRVTRLVSIHSIVLVFVRHISIREAFGRNSLSFEEVVDVIFESWILADQFIQQFFVLAQLAFQVSAVSQVDFALELVEIGALIEQRLDISKEVVDVIHAFLVSGVDELADGGFEADAAAFGVLVFFLFEAVEAEEAVAIEDELADLFEAGLAFVPMLYVLVHDYRLN